MNKEGSNPGGSQGGRVVSRLPTVCDVKCPVFNKKIMKHTRKGRYDPYHERYIQVTETAQMLCLADKLHQSYYKYVQGEFGD